MSHNMGLERILQHEFERVPLQRPRTHFRLGAPELEVPNTSYNMGLRSSLPSWVLNMFHNTGPDYVPRYGP